MGLPPRQDDLRTIVLAGGRDHPGGIRFHERLIGSVHELRHDSKYVAATFRLQFGLVEPSGRTREFCGREEIQTRIIFGVARTLVSFTL